MHRICRAFVLIGIALITFWGCDDSSDKDLPVETRKWITSGDGYYQFYTNDPQYYGYSFWYTHTSNDPAATFTTFTGVAKKIEGAPSYGYGFLFCLVDSDNYYRLLISVNGNYQVAKRIAGQWYTLISWTASNNLHRGMGVDNIVTVTRNATTNEFSVSFNGVASASFNDTSLTRASFSACACIGTAEDEDFPNSPVDVRIKFTSPWVFPAASARSPIASSQELSERAGFEGATLP